ncbi:hypothetical protein PInf_017880 [Phytophthora infestans]|nr:hypothetical protein PInf_017880 [Phytophthora infestans]
MPDKEASEPEDSAITLKDPEERLELVLHDEEHVIEIRDKFGVTGSSFVGRVNSATSGPNTRSACTIHSVTARSAQKGPDEEGDLEAVPATRKVFYYVTEAFWRMKIGSAVAASSTAQRPNVGTANFSLKVLHSGYVEPYGEDTSSTVTVSSHGDKIDAQAKFGAARLSRGVIPLEGIKPNDDTATADSALKTLDDENSSGVIRQHDLDAPYLGYTSKHVEVRSAVVVGSADTCPHVKDNYALSEVSLLRGTETDPEVTSSTTLDFDPGGVGYGSELTLSEETASQTVSRVNKADLTKIPEPSPAELSWADDECCSTGNPMETLRLYYLAIVATEDEQGGDVDVTRQIAAFVCTLGHFEWLRMLFGLKNAPMIYQRLIDNAFWECLYHEITPSGIRADTKKMAAIAELSFPKSKKGMQAFFGALNYYGRFIQNLAVYGAVLYQHKDTDFCPRPHDDKLHPVYFCGRVLKEYELGYHPSEKEVVALLQLLKVCYIPLSGKTLHVYTRFSTLGMGV